MKAQINSYKTLLSADKLSLGYKQKNNQIYFLQQELDLQLFEGEMVCLIGPNGCGKSTLIRTLSGLQQPVSGKVLLEETDITDLHISKRSDLLGVVLTDKDAVESITVREIVSLGRYQSSNWLGLVNKSDEVKISDSVELVGLAGFDHRMYGSLSDGEKQRAFIAKILASDSLVMLLDEPTAHLDIPNKVSIMTLLRDLTRKSGHALLVSTHELDLALQLADQIWLMIPGENVFKGTPEELLQSGQLDKVFGNEKLTFNPGSGSFCVKTNNFSTILIEGDEDLCKMTIQAAQRLGYKIIMSEKADLIVKVEESQWMVTFKNELVHFNDFTQLCRFLEKAGKQNPDLKF